MQSIQSKNQKKYLKKASLITLCVILLVGVGVATYVYGFNGNLFGWSSTGNQDKQTADNNAGTTESTDNSNNLQEDTVDEGEGKPNTSSDETTTENGNNAPDSSNTLAASITAASQNGSTLQIRTLIEEVVSGGNCTLTLTQDTKKVTKNASTQALSSSSTCQGFDVATSELAPGSWTITIDITTSGKTAHLNKVITIN